MHREAKRLLDLGRRDGDNHILFPEEERRPDPGHLDAAQEAAAAAAASVGTPSSLSAQAVMAAQAVNDNWTAAFQRSASQHMTASAAFAGHAAGFAAAGMYGWY